VHDRNLLTAHGEGRKQSDSESSAFNKTITTNKKYGPFTETITAGYVYVDPFIYNTQITNFTFVGPCIVIYSYSKTNRMHNISNLFYFETTRYMFRTVSPSIIRSLRLYIQHQVYVIQFLWLLASKQPQNLYGMMLCVQS